ncbi:little elongation complex subunit 2 [Plakobranchus ocellatus]|uniref:Little elongation complex subunit 2 n=1 Tax=Plakobranchus ocellatus TaxID=259542 RepID=A0AAV4DTU0_9GAST|nr:little elongation complex subunit 2 [Plakobranchus ocellatus]
MSEESTSKGELTADEILKKFALPEFLKKGRNNPINGRDYFFSESSFHKVVGPEPSPRERFMIQMARARERQKEKPAAKNKQQKEQGCPSQTDTKPIVFQTPKSDTLSQCLDLPSQEDSGSIIAKSPKFETLSQNLNILSQRDSEPIVFTPATNDVLSEKSDSHSPQDSGAKVPKLPCAEPLSHGLADLTETANNEGSAEDDELKTNLVIADGEEHLKNQNILEIGSLVSNSSRPVHRESQSKTSQLPKTDNFYKEPSGTDAGDGNKDDDSDDDDDLSIDLIIADVEEQRKDKTLCESDSPFKKTCELAGAIVSVPKSDKKIPLFDREKADAEQSKPMTESLMKNEKEIPLYATGISSRVNISLPIPMETDIARQEPSGTASTGSVQEGEDVPAAQPDPEPETEPYQVLPSIDSGSDRNNDAVPDREMDTPKALSSSLPLIPALMSEPPNKDHKAEKSLDVKEINAPKLDMAPKFYVGDAGMSTSNSESKLLGSSSSKEALAYKGDKTDSDIGDVPIFSVADLCDDVDEDNGSKRLARKKGIWLTEQQKMQPKQKSVIKDNSVKEAMKFRQSSLTREEMARYLNLFGKYVRPFLSGGCRPVFTDRQKNEWAQFEALQQRVQREQREFQGYLQQNALRNPQFYNFIKAPVKHYALAKAQNYRPHKAMVMKFSSVLSAKIPLESGTEQAELVFKHQLLEIGSPPKIVLPDIKSGNNPVPIPHDVKKLEQNFPRCRRFTNMDILHHESVGEDSNARSLALKYGISAVLSSSVVKCLLDNRKPGFSHTWNIPVTVREYAVPGGKHKIVYLNKPIFEENLLLRDYSSLFHKYALRVMISQPNLASFKEMRQLQRQSERNACKKRQSTETVDDPFDVFATDLETLETFGKGLASKDGSLDSPKVKDVKVEEASCRRSKRIALGHLEKEEGIALLTASLDTPECSQSVLPEKCGPEEKSLNTVETPDQLAGQTRSRLRKRTLNSPNPSSLYISSERAKTVDPPAKKTKSPNACESNTETGSAIKIDPPPAKVNPCKQKVSGELWAGKEKKSRQQQEKTFSDDAQVRGNLLDLILGPDSATEEGRGAQSLENPSQYTAHTECLSSVVYSQWSLGQNKILIRTRSHGTLKARNIYLTTKLEYQASHGLEQVTAEEMVRDWAACYIRPNTKLLRARVNAFTSEILMFEELEVSQILRATHFRPGERFSFIDRLLKCLSSLDEGSYLVSHEPGENFCGIRAQKSEAR